MPYDLDSWVNGQLRTSDDEDVNIEVDHIHPQSPEDVEIDEDFKHRVGNLSILPEGENKSLQNAAQADKQESYKSINLEMNREIVEDLPRWDEDAIEAREEDIVEHVLQEWPQE